MGNLKYQLNQWCIWNSLVIPSNYNATVFDANATWLGYMNVFELPENGGGLHSVQAGISGSSVDNYSCDKFSETCLM